MYTPEFPPRTRFAADQVPLEIDQNHYTLSPKGDHFVYLLTRNKTPPSPLRKFPLIRGGLLRFSSNFFLGASPPDPH